MDGDDSKEAVDEAMEMLEACLKCRSDHIHVQAILYVNSNNIISMDIPIPHPPPFKSSPLFSSHSHFSLHHPTDSYTNHPPSKSS